MQEQFNPTVHMRQIKTRDGSQDYLDVKWRLVWFRESCPQGTIDTEEIIIDVDRECEAEIYQWNNETRRSEKVVKRARGYARFKAIVCDGKGGRATAHGSESAVDFSEYIEKAETKAVGRALAMLGFGTAFAPELNEEHRIVDAPVAPSAPAPAPAPASTPIPDARSAQNVAQGLADAPASDQQKEAIKKLRLKLGMPLEQRQLTYVEAKEEIVSLSTTWNEMQRKGRAS